MAIKNIDLGMTGYDELFINDESRAELRLPKVQNIALDQIDGFEEHPFKIKDDEEMQKLVQRYIRLTELIPELLSMVDENKIAFRPAVEISYLKADEQRYLLETIRCEDCTPSLSQAQRLKKISQEGMFTKDTASDILAEEKPNQKEQLRFPVERLRKYFPRKWMAQWSVR